MAMGLYIHIPFCLKKCFYCDFTSYPLQPGDIETFVKALYLEIALYGRSLPAEDREVSSVFIGGGTPTCLPAAGLKGILYKVGSVFKLLPGCEISVEANPGTLDLNSLTVLREAGFNRLSMGVQAFQDHLLELLGRVHSAEEAEEAVKMARAAGFSNLNLDFIFGVPGQTAADWTDTLQKGAGLAPEHIAVYGLQLEEGTPLERDVAVGRLQLCSEDLELWMYRTAIDFLTSKGYLHYEVSNFSRPGKESVHNLGYWYNCPYLGLGPAAHSYLGGRRFSNELSLFKYTQRLSLGEFPVVAEEAVPVKTEMAETMFLGLRLRQGVDLQTFYRRFGRPAEEVYRKQIDRLTKEGMLEFDGRFLRLSGKGLPVANRVFMEFV